jgi:hypothetical protein
VARVLAEGHDHPTEKMVLEAFASQNSQAYQKEPLAIEWMGNRAIDC